MKEPPGVPDGSFASRAKSDGAQILSRGLACLRIRHNVERDLLPLIEAVHSCALDLLDVHEDILAAIIRLDESVAFVWIEPLHRALSHSPIFQVLPPSEGIASAGRNRKCIGRVRQIKQRC